MEIRLATTEDVSYIDALLQSCKKDMDDNGIFQWTLVYPNSGIIKDDIEKGQLYVLEEDQIKGIVVLSEDQEPEYAEVDWSELDGNVMVVHRLAVDPESQRNGYARILMDFAEDFAVEHEYTSIRLDAFSKNNRVLKFYEQRNYEKRGLVNFEGRTAPFYCLELDVSGGQ